MNTRLTACCHGIFLLLITGIPQAWPQANTAKWGSVMFAENLRVAVEIADTPQLRAAGLMHRDRLEARQGMLFVYPEQIQQGVWMKNTLLALDVLFLSEHGQVVAVLQNLPPCPHEPCPIYTSGVPARYMLEVQAGFAAKHGIKTGREVMIEYHH